MDSQLGTASCLLGRAVRLAPSNSLNTSECGSAEASGARVAGRNCALLCYSGEQFGALNVLVPVIHWIASVPIFEFALTWGTVVIELSIACLLLFGKLTGRVIAVVLSALLHVGIILVSGLWSFAFTMVGAMIATLGGLGMKDLRH